MDLKDLAPKKKDFIPNRCTIGGALPASDDELMVYDEGYQRPAINYPACVCFWDGTCEFRSDHSRNHWCYYGGAVSVNEGERCPDLQGASLHVCPIRYSYDLPMSAPPGGDPGYGIEEPVYGIEEPVYAMSSEPTLGVAAKQRRVAKKQEALTIAPVYETPLYPIDPIYEPPVLIAEFNGCICTDDGVCSRSYVWDEVSTCDNDDRVVAVVKDGPCPRSSACKLRAPADTYVCQDSDRNTGGDFLKICPQYFAAVYGCVCYKDGTCENAYGDSCENCQRSEIVSVSSSQCECR